MTDYAHSSYATSARQAKAAAIEAQLRQEGIPLAAARTLPDASRRRVARTAGVRPGSPETWELVFRYMASAEQRAGHTVTTTCRDCGATMTVPTSWFDTRQTATHLDAGQPCTAPAWWS